MALYLNCIIFRLLQALYWIVMVLWMSLHGRMIVFISKFEDMTAKQWVKDHGPWFISKNPYFLVASNLGPIEKLSLQKVPIWIRLWNVPL